MSIGNYEDGGHGAYDDVEVTDLGEGVDLDEIDEVEEFRPGGDDIDLRYEERAAEFQARASEESIRALAAHDAELYGEAPTLKDPADEEKISRQIARRAERSVAREDAYVEDGEVTE